MLRWLLTGASALLGAACPATAQDKGPYSLFNPTPDRLLREMTTDRPDITESPFTVDAGHVQIETTILGFTRSGRDKSGAITEAWELATTNIRIGLTGDWDVGLIWQPYGVAHMHGPAGTLRQSGIGGLELRTKLNLWGNDTFEKAGTALAVMPFVLFPTDRHNGISPEAAEGGLIVPYALKLSNKFELAMNAGVAWAKDDGTGGYQARYIASASLGYEWSEKLSTYYELAGQFNANGGDEVVLGTGVTYHLSKNVQLDAGVNFGITPAADRFNPFIGLSMRF
jgi:hypothetical protein